MDRTNRILRELKIMLNEENYDSLKIRIEALIDDINQRRVNLMEYQRFDSRQKFGNEIVDAVIVADQRQREAKENS